MTNDQIRVAIAELCGWKHPTLDMFDIQRGPDGKMYMGLPNYPESFDACREFTQNASKQFWDMLYDVCNPGGALGCIDGIEHNDDGWMRTCAAMPRQLCESVLRLNGKWTL